MRAFLVVIGWVAACGHGSSPEPVPPVPPPPVVISPLLSMVGAAPRGFANLSLTEPRIHDQLAAFEAGLGAELGKSLGDCGIALARLKRLRVAIGEPLRIAAELDGAIDVHAIACLVGEAELAAVARIGLVVRNRPGGIAIEYHAEPAPDRARPVADDLARRCTGASCAAVMLGPADRRLWMQLSLDGALRIELSGPALGHGATTVAAAFGSLRTELPALQVLTVREQRGALIVEAPRDPSPASSVTLGLIVRARLIEAFKIPSSSMVPSLVVGDHIFAGKGPLLGELVPGDLLLYQQDDRIWVKRYLAGPGQTIAETDAGISIDGKLLPTEVIDPAYHFKEYEEGFAGSREHTGALVREHLGARSYLTVRTGPPRQAGTWTVPPGHVFFVGDNRNNSNDSRYLGATAKSAVVGRVLGTWLAIRDGLLDWDRMGIPID